MPLPLSPTIHDDRVARQELTGEDALRERVLEVPLYGFGPRKMTRADRQAGAVVAFAGRNADPRSGVGVSGLLIVVPLR